MGFEAVRPCRHLPAGNSLNSDYQFLSISDQIFSPRNKNKIGNCIMKLPQCKSVRLSSFQVGFTRF